MRRIGQFILPIDRASQRGQPKTQLLVHERDRRTASRHLLS